MDVDSYSMLRDLLAQEQALFGSLTNNIFLLVALILGAQFLWSFIQSRREMKDLIKRNSEQFKLQLDKYKEELKSYVEFSLRTTRQELQDLRGDLCRSYANDCDSRSFFGLCFVWRLNSIFAYHEAKNARHLRLSIDILVTYIKEHRNDVAQQLREDKDFSKEHEVKSIKKLPDVLADEKNFLIEFLNEVFSSEPATTP